MTNLSQITKKKKSKDFSININKIQSCGKECFSV